MECRKSTVQDYECQVKHFINGQWIAFDGCLAKELFWLWDKGITTIGSCCGKHTNSNKDTGAFIQVRERDIHTMLELGYEEDKNYKYKPCNSFVPKSNL
jgi:hypothetical protein